MPNAASSFYSEHMENNLMETLSSGMVRAVAQAAQSVVTVWGGRRPISGVVVAPERVLTVDHVLEGDEARVTVEGGHKWAASVLGRDPSSDLALLRVEGLTNPALAVGQDPELGQLVLWVARPDAVMVSHGVVSAVGGPVSMGRGMRGQGQRLERYFRSDAQPYPGFSGGAFINLNGAMVGLGNAGVLRGQGVGIPASLVVETVGLMAQGERRPHPFLGIGSQSVRLPSEGASRRGLLVVSVDPQSPAARAGLFIGDVLLSFGGVALEDTDDLQAQLSRERIGQSFALEIVRAGAQVTLSLEVGARAEKS